MSEIELIQLAEIAETPLEDAVGVYESGAEMDYLLLDRPSADTDEPTNEDAELASKTTQLYRSYESGLEDRYAQYLLDGHGDLGDYPLYKRYSRLLTQEVELCKDVSGNQPARLLCLGSGPIPLSAILFFEMTGTEVACYDTNYAARKRASQVIGALGLQSSIQVLEHSPLRKDKTRTSAHYNLESFDTIHVSLAMTNENQLLNHVLRNMLTDTTLIIRSTEGNRQFMYPPSRSLQKDIGARSELVEHCSAGIDDVASISAFSKFSK